MESFLQIKLLKINEEFFAAEHIKSLYFFSEAEGQRGILPNHTDFFAIVKPGKVQIELLSGEKKEFYTQKGFLLVEKNVCTLVSENFS